MVLGLRCLRIAKQQCVRKGLLYCLRAPEIRGTCTEMEDALACDTYSLKSNPELNRGSGVVVGGWQPSANTKLQERGPSRG